MVIYRDTSHLSYIGITSGSQYEQAGNGANYLCLPKDPIYGQVEAGVDIYAAYIYGSEYRRTKRYSKTSLGKLTGHGAPCAICLAPGKSVQIMVPAKNVCPSNEWTTEYKGYLFAMRNDWKGKTEYVCVDENAETVPGSSDEYVEGTTTLHPVEGRCVTGGSLPCGPYVDGHELTCAVCSI